MPAFRAKHLLVVFEYSGQGPARVLRDELLSFEYFLIRD